jgi:hypothetical protein
VQSSFNILSAAYQLLNITSVNDVISGKVMIGSPDLTGQSEDVAINLLNNPNQYLQTGLINVNIHIPKLSNGRHDLPRLNELVELILPLLEDASIKTTKGNFYFQVEDDKGVFDDNDRDGMSYYNIRVTFQTIN